MGEVDKLPSGRYRARVDHRGRRETLYPPDGSRSWTDPVAADVAIQKREREIDGYYVEAGLPVARQQQQRRTEFATYAKAWAAGRDAEPVTRASSLANIRQMIKQWPGVAVEDITRQMVREYMAAMRAAGLGASARSGRLTTLRAVMIRAVEDELRDSDPTVGIRVPAPVARPHRIVTEHELAAAMEHMPAWLYPAPLLAYDSGLRIGECAGLRIYRCDLLHASVLVADVVLPDGTVREYPKGRKPLSVPLSDRTVVAIRALLDAYPAGSTDHLFRHPRTGARLKPERIRAEWDAARNAAQLAKPLPRFHDLRHSCARNLATAEAPAYVIKTWLRHRNLATSQTYIGDVSGDELARWGRRAQSSRSSESTSQDGGSTSGTSERGA